MRSSGITLPAVLSFGLATLAGPNLAAAYQYYDDPATGMPGCTDCHGDFGASLYTSLADGMDWAASLHIVHRFTMLSSECNACHSGGSRTPVIINLSTGGNGLAAISCMGCHGRAEDDSATNPSDLPGAGAGLRQHHFRAGEVVCVDCHADSDPAAFAVVGEEVLPPYYAMPGTGHPAIPDDSCNPAGGEDFAASMDGLDNDGDGIYDMMDFDCSGCTDADGDLFSPDGAACGMVDCDDADATSHPGGTEVCDDADNNCDGTVDEALTQACSTACGDGNEMCAAGAWVGCDAPPVEAELCDGMDNDCNGMVDDMCTGADAGVDSGMMMGTDGGMMGTDDGGMMGTDAGPMTMDGGCSCRVPGPGGNGGTALPLLAAVFFLVRRRWRS